MAGTPDGPDAATAVRLHQLEGFWEVGRHGGYRRAAQAIAYPITEPALHHQVKRLEKALGVKLLERAPGRRMVLTAEGRALHDFVTPFFERLPGVLRQIAGEGAGRLVIGAEPFYVEPLCAPALAALRDRFGGAHIGLLEMDASDMGGRLVRGEIDLGVGVADPDALPEGVVAEPLGTLGLCLLAPKGHPLAGARAPIRPARIAEHGFVAFEPGTAAHAFTARMLARQGVTLRVVASASSTAAIVALVRAGVAPAFVPVLGRARRPARGEGVTAIDLTSSLRREADLPRIMLLRRAGAAPAGLLAACAEELVRTSKTRS